MGGMHPFFERASGLTETIIAAAIEVHRDKGPGLIESIYEWCLTKEFELRGLTCVSQKLVMIEYNGFTREEPLRFDMLLEGCVLVEAKAAEKILPIHKAQLLSYMKLLNVPLGLLINFHEIKLTDAVHRLSSPEPTDERQDLTGANRENRDGKQEALRFLCCLLFKQGTPAIKQRANLRDQVPRGNKRRLRRRPR
jgi:GxxExxY protein